MALDDLTLEGFSERNAEGALIKAWRSKAISHLSGIDTVFNNLEAMKTKYAAEPNIVTEMEDLIATLKLAMFNSYNSH